MARCRCLIRPAIDLAASAVSAATAAGRKQLVTGELAADCVRARWRGPTCALAVAAAATAAAPHSERHSPRHWRAISLIIITIIIILSDCNRIAVRKTQFDYCTKIESGPLDRPPRAPHSAGRAEQLGATK